jgi:hypothetical protein
MFGSDFNKCPLFYRTQKGLGDSLVVNITLDMDKRTIDVNGAIQTNLPSEVYAAVCIKSESAAILKHM